MRRARRMEELRIPRDGPVCFAQLQGVAEHLGLALGERFWGAPPPNLTPYCPPNTPPLPHFWGPPQFNPLLPTPPTSLLLLGSPPISTTTPNSGALPSL